MSELFGSDVDCSKICTAIKDKMVKLQEQLEKMKCCGNCRHKNTACDICYLQGDCTPWNKNLWELKDEA